MKPLALSALLLVACNGDTVPRPAPASPARASAPTSSPVRPAPVLVTDERECESTPERDLGAVRGAFVARDVEPAEMKELEHIRVFEHRAEVGRRILTGPDLHQMGIAVAC